MEAGKEHAGKGRFAEAKTAFELALELAVKASDRAAEGQALLGLGNALLERGDRPVGEPRLQQALDVFRDLNDKAGQAMAFQGLGDASLAANDLPGAQDRYGKALALQRETGDRHGQAETLYRLGTVHYQAGRYDAAIEACEAALPLYRETSDPRSEAEALASIGAAQSALDRPAQALESFEKALPLQRTTGDRRGEAITLSNIASVLDDLGEKRRALEYCERALSLRREVGDRRGEAITLSRMGSLHDDLGQKATALEYYEKALPIRREVKDRRGEAYTLNNIGLVYSDLGQKDRAVEYYEKALPILREVGDRRTEAVTLQNLGVVYDDLGRKARAVEYFEKTLPILRGIKDRRNEAITLQNLGRVYWSLGQQAKAFELYEKALVVAREQKDRRGEAIALFNIGAVRKSLGENPRAMEYFQQALPLIRETGDRKNEAAVLSSMASVQLALGEGAKALDLYDQALALKRAVGDRNGEGSTLNNFGAACYLLGFKDRARECFRQALPLLREVGDRTDEVATLGHLMRVTEIQGKRYLAVLIGKQSIRLCQEIRGELRRLGPETRRSYLETVQMVYRNLAAILLKLDRPGEAHQVLSLLKEQEYFDYARGTLEEAGTPTVDFNGLEQRMDSRLQAALGKAARIGGELTLLRFRKRRLPEEETRLAGLAVAHEEARKAWEADLDAAGKEMETEGPREARLIPPTVKELWTDLENMGRGTAVVYTLLAPDQAWILGLTPGELRSWKATLPPKDLKSAAEAFRRWLQCPTADPRPAGRRLYDALVAPLKDWRQTMKVRRILWSLDGALRYVPLGALWNGKSYFIEELPVSVFTPAARLRSASVHGQRKALAAGVSRACGGFAALDGVPAELRCVVRQEGLPGGVFPGRLLLDEDFTEARLRESLKSACSVLHLASHFQFSPEGEQASFLLLGDGQRLSLEAMRTGDPLFRGLDLLTLSACQTGMGGEGALGDEIEGFGVMAQRQGAKSVIATLWPVADDSTRALMQGFYRAWSRQGAARSDALREAQLALMRGAAAVRTPGSERGDAPAGGSAVGSGRFVPPRKAPCAHPYYWASFILMGAWD